MGSLRCPATHSAPLHVDSPSCDLAAITEISTEDAKTAELSLPTVRLLTRGNGWKNTPWLVAMDKAAAAVTRRAQQRSAIVAGGMLDYWGF